MATEFETFARSLPQEEQDVFLASIPMLIAMVAGADRELQPKEAKAIVEQLLATVEQLGDDFRSSPAAQQEFDTLAAHIRWEVDREDDRRLMVLRTVLQKMPTNLARQYRSFAARVCADVAQADGGVLWFGNPISSWEAVALSKIVDALELELSAQVREMLDRVRKG